MVKHFLIEIKEELAPFANEDMLLGGDFNFICIQSWIRWTVCVIEMKTLYIGKKSMPCWNLIYVLD